MLDKKEVLTYLLMEWLEKGNPVLIVGLDDSNPDIPTIHNFYPRKYYESIEHYGWGFFEGKTEHGTFSFDAGGAMHHHRFDGGGWLSWSPLRTSNAEVLKDLGYDFNRVKSALKIIIADL